MKLTRTTANDLASEILHYLYTQTTRTHSHMSDVCAENELKFQFFEYFESDGIISNAKSLPKKTFIQSGVTWFFMVNISSKHHID